MAFVKALAKGMKKHPIATSIGVGFTVFDVGGEVKSELDKGNSAAVSVAKGGARWAAMELVPGLGYGMMGKALMDVGYMGARSIGEHNARIGSQMYKSQFGGNFTDTQNAYTMRQRGMSAIRNSGISNQNTLGNEARLHSRGRYE